VRGAPVAELFSSWSLAPAPALLVATGGALYFIGVERLRHRGRSWSPARSGCFAAGLVVLVVATQSFVASDPGRFDIHVVEHVLLGMAGPFLLALGAPVTLALQASSRRTQTRLLQVLHSPPVRGLSHPLVVGFLFGFTLFALYFTPLYGLSVRNVFVHEAVHAHFFLVGSLFFWITVGLDPVAWRIPYGARLALVLLTVPIHAFLGLALLSTTHPLDPHAVGAITTIVDTQHRGAAIMWVIGDLVGLAAGGVVLAQWMRHEERRGARIDRELDAAADAAEARDNPPRPATVR
jgi:putative membrane protein